MYILTVPALRDDSGAKDITGAVLALDGTATFAFDLASHKLNLVTLAELGDIRQALDAVGYPVEASEETSAGGCHCDMCD
ncbi:MAG: hypothetical protein ACO1PZ_17395 [Gammaproteobacteria bacterium]